jgi:hypothetical protein
MRSHRLLVGLALSLALGLVVFDNISDRRVVLVADSEAAQIVAGGCSNTYFSTYCTAPCPTTTGCYSASTTDTLNCGDNGANACSASNCGGLTISCNYGI